MIRLSATTHKDLFISSKHWPSSVMYTPSKGARYRRSRNQLVSMSLRTGYSGINEVS